MIKERGKRMADKYILEMHHITKKFPGVKALDDVSLYVRPGTVHSLMGKMEQESQLL